MAQTTTGSDVGTTHRTAMARTVLSRPIRLAIETGLITPDSTVFDYGCGRGGDLRMLRRRGIAAHGWDPVSRPRATKREAEVVNLGYVVNVVRDPIERASALKSAWNLASRALVVSARLMSEMNGRLQPAGDGFFTSTGTFQRFFTQAELRAWIDDTLEVESVALAPGVFVVFRDEALAQEWLASRRRTAVSVARVSVRDQLYEAHRPLLDRLMEFYADRGRLPATGETPWDTAVSRELGSVARAWQVVRHVTDDADWEQVRARRTDELRVYLALARLRRRPRFSALPDVLQHDVKALFGSYKAACADADALLRGAGDLVAIRATAHAAPVGKRTATDLYLHEEALDTLPPLLQVYEGCARWIAGYVDGANLVKLAWDIPKVSYLAYPTFDTDPHPALVAGAVVHLRDLSVELRDYTRRANPPILHRKETFVHDAYPGRDKFARLTRQEERFGLYDDAQGIGTRRGWEDALDEAGVQLRGHRVVRTRS